MAFKGSVRFFNSDRGFGFIVPDQGGPDVFVHVHDLRKSGRDRLPEGQKVSYETVPGREGKGPKAINIQVVQ